MGYVVVVNYGKSNIDKRLDAEPHKEWPQFIKIFPLKFKICD